MIKPLLFFLLLCSIPLHAALKVGTIAYDHDGSPLEGYYAYEDTLKSPRPAILLVHAWNGLGDYEKSRVTQLAEQGYVVMALDMYGRDNRPATQAQAAKQSGFLKANVTFMRERAMRGLQTLETLPFVNTQNITVVGYCFGGTVALEMARGKLPIQRAVSFHGDLRTPMPLTGYSPVQILVFHGADDPFVSQQEVRSFVNEMKAAKVAWQLVMYGGAVHAFSDPSAGQDPSKGAAYNALADKRSWQTLLQFLGEARD